VFTFANKAGLHMLETSLVALQDLTLDKIFDESGRKALFSEISKLVEEVELLSCPICINCHPKSLNHALANRLLTRFSLMHTVLLATEHFPKFHKLAHSAYCMSVFPRVHCPLNLRISRLLAD
jgi:hypothetical protein